MIHELNPGTIWTISNSNGQSAPRRFVCDTYAEVVQLCADLNRYPYPGEHFKGCWPTSITVSPFNDGMAPTATTETENEEGDTVAAYLLGVSTYKQYIVSVQYQTLLNFKPDFGGTEVETWPASFEKPGHADGTTLSCRIRNSGRFLTIPGSAGKALNPDDVTEAGPIPPLTSIVQILPTAELHITWDRLEDWQVPDFKKYTGRVNEDDFMGCDPEELLCESADIDHSFVADLEKTNRFRVTVILRRMRIEDADGTVWGGWNHEYLNLSAPKAVNGPAWYRVQLSNGQDRYPRVPMWGMFGGDEPIEQEE
jgi:hypothetical protein